MATNNSSSGKKVVNPYKSVWNNVLGWGISTILLWLFNRHNKSSSSDSQDPSDYTGSNVNQIGSAIPVVMGRAMIKNPLVSYYGDFRADIYTEEYGMHTGFDWRNLLVSLLLSILSVIMSTDKVVVFPGQKDTHGDTTTTKGEGAVKDSGVKRAQMLNAIIMFLLQLLLALFTKHMGKTTIQKGFKYYLGWQHILCWTGDEIGIKKIWMNVYDSDVEESTETGVWGDGVAWKANNTTGLVAHIDDEDMFGGVDEGGGFVGDVRLYFGTQVQGRDGWMVRQMTISENVPDSLKGLTPVYPMFFTCVICGSDSTGAYIGKQATIPEMWFEVVNYPHRLHDMDSSFNYKIGEDANPAEVIYEILKNKNWGCDYPDDRVDVDSLITMAKTLSNEEMGISCHINQVNTVGTYISKILTHVNGVCYDDPRTGKLVFKLIRDDYDIADLPSFNTTNCSSMEFTRLDWSETSNVAVTSFTYADAKYDTGTLTVSDIANMRITHNYAEKNIDGEYFTTTANAKTFAKTQLLSMAYPLSTIQFRAGRQAYSLTAGQPILISWTPYGISQQVFRVTYVDYGTLTNGEITVTAIEDVFGFEKTDYDNPDPINFDDGSDTPVEISHYQFLEIPYEFLNTLDTYIYSYAIRPSQPTVAYVVWRYLNSTYIKGAQSSNFNTGGQLNYLLPELYDEDSNTFTITPLGYNYEYMYSNKIEEIDSAPTQYTNTSGLNLLLIDDEIISFSNITKNLNGTYQVNGVLRGIYDTLPRAHNAYSYIYFLDTKQSISGDNPICDGGETSAEQLEICAKSATKEESFDIDKVTGYTTVRRSEAPSIMGNLTFAEDKGTLTSYSHNYPATTIFASDIYFKFNTRNKFSVYGIVKQTDDSVVPETTTKHIIECITEDVDFELTYDATETTTDSDDNETTTAIDAITLSWAEFCQNAGYTVEYTNNVTLYVREYNTDKEIYSYDKYTKSIIYQMPILVGVVGSLNDLKTYVSSVAESTGVVVPETVVSPQQSYSYQSACLVFVGVRSSTSDANVGICVVGQDGNYWDISDNVCYRIDGLDENNNAVYHQINIDEYYTMCSNFTTNTNNYSAYFRYRGENTGWLAYSPQ